MTWVFSLSMFICHPATHCTIKVSQELRSSSFQPNKPSFFDHASNLNPFLTDYYEKLVRREIRLTLSLSPVKNMSKRFPQVDSFTFHSLPGVYPAGPLCLKSTILPQPPKHSSLVAPSLREMREMKALFTSQWLLTRCPSLCPILPCLMLS